MLGHLYTRVVRQELDVVGFAPPLQQVRQAQVHHDRDLIHFLGKSLDERCVEQLVPDALFAPDERSLQAFATLPLRVLGVQLWRLERLALPPSLVAFPTLLEVTHLQREQTHRPRRICVVRLKLSSDLKVLPCRLPTVHLPVATTDL